MDKNGILDGSNDGSTSPNAPLPITFRDSKSLIPIRVRFNRRNWVAVKCHRGLRDYEEAVKIHRDQRVFNRQLQEPGTLDGRQTALSDTPFHQLQDDIVFV